MNDYQEQLLENYHNPKNFGEPTFEFTHTAKVSNLSCGDELQVWLKVSGDGAIEDICFFGEGCSISIATASLLYELLKGKTLDHVNALSDDYSIELIGIPLTMSRIKCAVLSLEAVKNSINS